MRLFALLLGATACAHVVPMDADSARRSLLQADIDFAHDVELRGTDAWVDAFASDGAMLVDGGGMIRGHDELRKAMSALGDPRHAPGKVQIKWTPLGAEVSKDGTLGWTYGNALVVSAKSKEKLKYVTIWRREGEVWKAVADIGNAGDVSP
jgi:ketosteroid isomerase-like protein